MTFAPGISGNNKGRPREYRVTLADLKRMRDARMGTTAIATLYGCDQSTVRSWLKRFGLPTTLDRPAPEPEAIDRAIASANARRERRLAAYPATLPEPKDA